MLQLPASADLLNGIGFVHNPQPELEEESPWAARNVHFTVRLSGAGFVSSSEVCFPLPHKKQANVLPPVYSPGPFICKVNVPEQVSALPGCDLGFSSKSERACLPQASPSGPQTVTSVKLAVTGALTCEMNSARPAMNAATRTWGRG